MTTSTSDDGLSRARNPYVGPRSFQEDDQDRFFGRENEGRDLLALVLADRLVVFYAQSGAGKTSLVNARLVPALRKKGFDVLPVGRVGGDLAEGVEPANIFTFNLLARLSAANPDLAARPHLSSELAPLSLPTYFGASVSHEESPSPTGYRSIPTALIIDQFEEVFTTQVDADQARFAFFEQLRDAQAAFPGLWVVLAMREEFIAQLDAVAYLMPNRLESRFYMQRMTIPAALDAIREPARAQGVHFADDAAEELVRELRAIRVQAGGARSATTPGRFVEPVQLQVVCYALWEHLPPTTSEIDLSHVRQWGDVDRALSSFYETTLTTTARTASVSESCLRDWFEHKLITSGGTRAFVYRGRTATEELPNAAVDVLEREHLIRAEQRAAAVWIELTHDRMIEPIRASNAVARQRNRRNQLRWASVAAVLLLVALGGYTFQQQSFAAAVAIEDARVATSQSLLVRVAEATAAVAQNQLTTQNAIRNPKAVLAPTTNALASLTSQPVPRPVTPTPTPPLATTPTPADTRAPAVASQTASDPLPTTQASPSPAPLASPPRPVLTWSKTFAFDASNADAYWVDYNARTHRAVTAGADGTVRLWNDLTSDTTKSIWRPGKGAIYTATFSPDGGRVLVGGVGALAQIWDVASGTVLVPLQGHANDVMASAFDQDGTRAATSGFDLTTIVWDAATGAAQRRLTGHADVVSAIAFRPRASAQDHVVVATGSWDGTARVWDVDTGSLATVLPSSGPGPGGKVWSVAFSPDGQCVLTGSDDGTIRWWSLRRGALVKQWTGHTAGVTSLTFSPDHNRVLSTSGDATARVWDIASGGAQVLSDSTMLIWSGTFVDNRVLLTTASDGNVRVWVANPEPP